MPNRAARSPRIENVPPYRQRWAITWSPGFSSASSTELIAPIPEAVAIAAAPPSRSASAVSSARVVGLARRV